MSDTNMADTQPPDGYQPSELELRILHRPGVWPNLITTYLSNDGGILSAEAKEKLDSLEDKGVELREVIRAASEISLEDLTKPGNHDKLEALHLVFKMSEEFLNSLESLFCPPPPTDYVT